VARLHPSFVGGGFRNKHVLTPYLIRRGGFLPGAAALLARGGVGATAPINKYVGSRAIPRPDPSS